MPGFLPACSDWTLTSTALKRALQTGQSSPQDFARFSRGGPHCPQAVAYVGDAPYDIDAAKHAGVIAVAAAWAISADAAALAARQPQVLFRSVAEFAVWAARVSQ